MLAASWQARGGAAYCRQGAPSAAAGLRLHALASSSAERPQAVLREGIRVPALLGAHVVAVAGVDRVVQAVVVGAGLVVGALVVVLLVVLLLLLVQVGLAELLLVGVELARGHPVQGARLVAVRAGRPRRLLVVCRVHVGGVVGTARAAAMKIIRAQGTIRCQEARVVATGSRR